jgi:single-stranded-DNA-specific exonuclease
MKSSIQWILKENTSPEEVKGLQSAVNASETLATLMCQRGIKDFESARKYFNPSVDQFYQPLLMKDMGVAVKRVTEAIENGEQILVYGDYDVDGTTAVSLVYDFLSKHTESVSFYIPDRYGEGYGISLKGIDFAADNDFALIIALDCGIKAIEQVDYALERGIDFIICDHHLPAEVLPKAIAILNPLQKDCDYPFKHLSGCGIGFKLVEALSQAWDLEPTDPYQYLDLVAIAAGCDIVSMTDENRILSHFGLKLLSETRRPGLELLLENGGRIIDGQLKRPLTITDLVFVIGPRINAAGRMTHGSRAVELLTARTIKGAEEAAKDIIQSNQDRREVDQDILAEALEMLDTNTNNKSTVLFAKHWHKGVVGIVASRVQEHFYRPTIILTESDGKITGSARSVHDFDIHAAIESCGQLLLNFGGHKAAAGLTLLPENLDSFREEFEKAVAKKITEDQLIPRLQIDVEIQFEDINQTFFEAMNRLAPFGPDNMRPIFSAKNLIDTGNSRCVGDGSHLKLSVTQGNGKKVMNGIAFGMGEYEGQVKSGKPFSAAFVIEENDFRGLKSLEMMVKDLKFSDL